MSLCWFTRVFKAIAGCAPTRYITNIRIKTAAQLLASSDDPINEIAKTLAIQIRSTSVVCSSGSWALRQGSIEKPREPNSNLLIPPKEFYSHSAL